jgi:hypothetical protein
LAGNLLGRYLADFLDKVFLHFAQTLILSPEDKVAHWRLGFFFILGEGL